MGSNAFLSNRRNAIALVESFLIECFLRWVSSILLPQLSVFLSTPLQRFCTYQSFFIIRSQTQSASVTSKSSFTNCQRPHQSQATVTSEKVYQVSSQHSLRHPSPPLAHKWKSQALIALHGRHNPVGKD